nr:hypothetical protein GCM10020063_008750 [Dactylosporangium thailandense]
MSADGRGVVGHAGARPLTDVADVTGLTGACSDVLAGLRQRRGGHDPGRIAVDLAATLADGGETISDLAVLRDQAALFGPVGVRLHCVATAVQHGRRGAASTGRCASAQINCNSSRTTIM